MINVIQVNKGIVGNFRMSTKWIVYTKGKKKITGSLQYKVYKYDRQLGDSALVTRYRVFIIQLYYKCSKDQCACPSDSDLSSCWYSQVYKDRTTLFSI